jgi:hypothetical protein
MSSQHLTTAAVPRAEDIHTAGFSDRIVRLLPLAGVLCAVLTAVGDLTIGDFPDESTSPSKIAAFYRDHHSNVAAGGRVLEIAAACFVLFAAGLVARLRRSSPAVMWLVAIGATVEAMSQAFGAAIYDFLGQVGGESAMTPSAMQALHAWGAAFGTSAGAATLGVGLLLAAHRDGPVPRWLGWTGAVLGVAQLSPLGFLFSLLFLLWIAVAGVVLAARPTDGDPVMDA